MFDTLFNFLKKIGHPVMLNLKEGLSIKDIQMLEIKFKISLPQELKNLYALYNGSSKTEDKTIGELSMFPNGIFLSLEEALEYFMMNKENHYWEETYFPLFTSGGGDYLLMQLAPEDDINRIYFYCPSNVDFETITSLYDNPFTMTQSIIKCFEHGIYFIQNGILETSNKVLDEVKICKPLNPLSEYWKIFKEV